MIFSTDRTVFVCIGALPSASVNKFLRFRDEIMNPRLTDSDARPQKLSWTAFKKIQSLIRNVYSSMFLVNSCNAADIARIPSCPHISCFGHELPIASQSQWARLPSIAIYVLVLYDFILGRGGFCVSWTLIVQNGGSSASHFFTVPIELVFYFCRG